MRDNLTLKIAQARIVLKKLLKSLNLNDKLYNLHSFHIRRSTDMIKFGYSIDQVKLAGQWWSNVVYKYIRDYTY